MRRPGNRPIVCPWPGVAVMMLVLANVSPCPAWQLEEAEFRRLHEQLQPVNEVWKTVPWMTSLTEAQNMSAVQGKPLLIWAMDGHPLGCT